MKNTIKLSDHFTYKKLLRFTVPSIVMMICTSMYGVIDGIFVSNYIGKTSLAAINFIMPVLYIFAMFGYMFGAGGSALVSKTLGEGDKKRANGLFSLFVYISIIFGVFMTIFGYFFMEPLVRWFGADGELLEQSLVYGHIFILALTAWILLYVFQLFFITAEKPKLGLWVTIASGVTNIVLDALFIVVFEWGIAGAAAASAIGQLVGGVFPIIYFARKNSSILRLTKPVIDFKAIFQGFANGSSELVSGMSASFGSILYNVQLLKYAGENGVAAYGVLMYISMIVTSIFNGYSSGIVPVIGYHYGARNHDELKSLLKKSIVVVGLFSTSIFTLSELLAYPIAKLYVGYDEELMRITTHGFFVYSFAFLFMGMAVFASSFFTALNNGTVSAMVAFLRTLVFETTAIIMLPIIFGVDGIWGSVVLAELMAAVVGIGFIHKMRTRYCYD